MSRVWSELRRYPTAVAGLAIIGLAVLLALAATYADMGALATRLEGSFSEGVAWLAQMRAALDEIGLHPEADRVLWDYLKTAAQMLVNTE